MELYKIIHKEEHVGYFYVEANSKEEALEEWNFKVNNGDIDFSKEVEMVDLSETAVLMNEDDIKKELYKLC